MLGVMLTEEERFIRFILSQKGIDVTDLTEQLVMEIRNYVTVRKSFDGTELQYVLNQGMENELILNTTEEYKEYLNARTC